MTQSHKITNLGAPWQPGDVVLDAKGAIRVRSAHPQWVWDSPGEGDTRGSTGGPVVPEGGIEDHDVPRPLTLLVRDGVAVSGRVVPELDDAAEYHSFPAT